jgi:8-oxo-dGTP pyrophosphatase MutT (NUDIX family)
MMVRIRKQIAALPWRRKKDRVQILLVTSRETRRWVIPKGWPMEHLIDSNAAKLEALEEAGVDGHVKRASVGTYNYEKRLASGDVVTCRVAVFALEVVDQLKKWPEKAERKRQWFDVNDAAWEVDEAGLKVIIRKFGGAE